MMRAIRLFVGRLAAVIVSILAGLALFAALRGRPQDLPWTPLDLSRPAGMATGRKIAGLAGEFPACRALLDKAGVRYTVLPRVRDGRCGYDDGVRFTTGGARRIAFAPADLRVACPVAAALAVWEWEVVQPAARRHLGQRVVRIDHFGSYDCRRLYGRNTGGFSEHATADAIDVAGFRLANGQRVTILRDWPDPGNNGAFLRAIRDGACDIFATVLSPDYNIAHRDHLHLDQAVRGRMGWRACR